MPVAAPSRRPIRRSIMSKTKSNTVKPAKVAPKASTKLELLLAKLGQDAGANLEELIAITGWQAHSVRGAMAGALKKKGYVVSSEKSDDCRRYRVANQS